MKKIVAFNWKMKPGSLEEAQALMRVHRRWANKYPEVPVISAPPMPFLMGLCKPGNVLFAGQNTYIQTSGSFTGESSPSMLREAGCKYVIVGHSNRREHFGETDNLISQKAAIAIDQGLIPIICFGENVRDDRGDYIDVLTNQLLGSIDTIPDNKITKAVLAYEPVWAISDAGNGQMDNETIFSTIILIKNILSKKYGPNRAAKIKILYGGSVNGDNVEEMSKIVGVDGYLIGRASLSYDHVKKIISHSAE